MENHLDEALIDPQKDEFLEECYHLGEQPPPSNSFNLKDTTLVEITAILRTARAKSAPGPSGLGYKTDEEIV